MDEEGLWRLFFETGLPQVYLAIAGERAAPMDSSGQPLPWGAHGTPVQAPLKRADSPCQGEMSRRDKRGRDAVAAARR